MKWNKDSKRPTDKTIQFNHSVAEKLGIDLEHATNEEYELAKSHCLKHYDNFILKDDDGKVIWNLDNYKFELEDKVPDSVNPSLWLNGKSLFETGIYSVVGKDIIQVRGFDVANIAFVRSKTGWIVIDSGTTVEGSRKAVEETEIVLGETIHDRIRAIIISHSHGDHFGGIAGIVKAEDVGSPDEGKIPIYVAGGFDEATMAEYVYAGGAMKRRGCYQVGARVLPGEYGKISVGCGLDNVIGTGSYIKPTNYIEKDTTIIIDGLKIDFQITNETEAVANMQNYFHDYHALWVADNCIGTMHNIYTMRGAKIRDAKLWAEALYESYVRYGEDAEVVFQGHAWPHWKTEKTPNAVKDVLLKHAAVYQFIHDQSLLYIGQGDTANEVAEHLKVPEEILRTWYLRPYYGTYDINARAIYHNYLGFYDGNPVNLHPLTEIENAKKFIEYVGSEEAVLEKAEKDFKEGNYQYAAQASNQVVFVNPDNLQARYLCADALEQLGYQSESAISRNAYLTGALELREYKKGNLWANNSVSTVLKGMDDEQLLDYLGMVIDGNKIEDLEEKILLQIQNSNPATYLLQFHGGALLKKKLSFDVVDKLNKEQSILLVKTDKKSLLQLVQKEKDAWKLFDERSQNLWHVIWESIVNLGEFSCFNIIEP